ncbi:MAG: hypothetical protein JWN38_401 [Candidatus Saccharibacteria bacterium]|nr:hypothetical protein [Candidatus Saccharibacteria bacterium]
MAEYVSLSDLAEATAQEESPYDVDWHFAMPPSVDTERIQLNISRLDMLSRIGGIGSNVVRGYQGDVSQYTPGIGGVNADGTAMASRAVSVTKAQTRNTGSSRDHDILPAHYDTITADHAINRAEMASQITDKIREGTTPEKAWAQLLDSELRGSVRTAGIRFLVPPRRERLDMLNKALDIFYMGYVPCSLGLFGYDISQGVAGLDTLPLGMTTIVYSVTIGLDSLSNKAHFGRTLLELRRWSIGAWGHQYDRALALNGLSRVPGLLKARK